MSLETPGDSIEIRIKRLKERANISPELVKVFDGMSIVSNIRGVFIADDKTGRSCGPYPHWGAMNSKEIGDYFGIPPRYILALILALSSGIEKFRFDEAMKVVADYRRRKGLASAMEAQYLAK